MTRPCSRNAASTEAAIAAMAGLPKFATSKATSRLRPCRSARPTLTGR